MDWTKKAEAVIGLAALLITALGIRELIPWIIKHRMGKEQRAVNDDQVKAQTESLRAETKSKDIESLTRIIDILDDRVATLEEEHQECMAKNKVLMSRIEGLEREIQSYKFQAAR